MQILPLQRRHYDVFDADFTIDNALNTVTLQIPTDTVTKHVFQSPCGKLWVTTPIHLDRKGDVLHYLHLGRCHRWSMEDLR